MTRIKIKIKIKRRRNTIKKKAMHAYTISILYKKKQEIGEYNKCQSRNETTSTGKERKLFVAKGTSEFAVLQ